MRERLKAKPNNIVCKYLFGPAIQEDSQRSFINMIKLNLAHALMLYKQDIISKEDTKELLNAFLNLQNKGPKAFELNPSFEDYYFNIEQYIISQIGLEIGGKIHTGRSRNDLHSTISRMNVRDSILELYPRIIDFRSILLNLASSHKETVLTGYTHMQPAQPITLSHYFTAIAEAIERDCQRLEGAYNRLNYCTLGSGAFAGTSFNIDRYYTAKRLGFYGPIENSIDAVASRDYLLEITSHFTTLGSTINRFVHDLYTWATDEFNLVEVDDSMAACSSIMPQKKNPITLEHIKGKTSHLLSAYVSVFTCTKGIPYGHSRDLAGESIHLYWDACYQMEAILELLNETLRTMKFKVENMKLRADQNYSTVTELADELVKEEKLPFRLAHQIVGHIVGNCIDRGLSAKEMTTKMLDEAGKIYVKRSFGWTQEHLDHIIDSLHSVTNKCSLGAPSPKECEKMIHNLKEQLAVDDKKYKNILKELQKSDDELKGDINSILNEI